MSLVLKLSKCRLCLKLGDFYSIFAVDNSTQLSKMAMACSEIKILEGDGLPDKICGECVEKLSAAFIFKQQCERSDVELRKSHPIADISSYGRRNSDSGFSNRTDVSSSRKDSSQSAVRSKRKRGNETESSSKVYSTEDGLLQESYSIDIRDPLSFEGTSGEKSYKKRRRGSESSDSDSNSVDEDEDSLFKCKENGCNETFTSAKSFDTHAEIHKNAKLPSNIDGLGGFPCLTCGKSFKLNVMLNRHMKDCKIQFKPVPEKFSWSQIINNTLKCPVCFKDYKKRIYLRKHLKRNACGDVIKENPEDFMKTVKKPNKGKNLAVECSNCDAEFPTYMDMYRHIALCLKQRGTGLVKCKTCDITYMKRESLHRHIKKTHTEDDDEQKESLLTRNSLLNESKQSSNSNSEGLLKCRECHKTFNDQMQLVMHLAAHMANKKDQMNREALVDVPFAKDYFCTVCSKQFKYRMSMLKHMKVEHGQETSEVKANHTFNCNLCDKTFMFRKSLIYHKNAKHNNESNSVSFYNELIEFSRCQAKCLHCKIMLDNFAAIKAHNKVHIDGNEKVKNEYSCPACSLQFTNTKFFRAHLSHHNANLKMRTAEMDAGENRNADFAENRPSGFADNVLVKIKVEPSESGDFCNALSDQGNSSTGQRLVVNMRGFTCPICGRTLETLENYQLHMNEHSTGSGFAPNHSQCLLCHESFESMGHLNDHLQMHAQQSLRDPASLVCGICKLRVKNFRGLYAHLKWHRQTTDFSCRICKMNFATKTAYVSHQKTHLFKRERDGEMLISTDFISEATPSGHQCKICQKFMLSTASLKRHLIWHAGKNSIPKANYFCNVCHKAFTNKYDHKLHMRVHVQSGGRHICPICMKYMKSAVHLSIHIQTHSDAIDAPTKAKYKKAKSTVPCPVCDREFSHQAMLNKHLQSAHPGSKMVKKNDPDAETVDKNHVCTICAKEFPSEHRLTRHLAMHNMKVSFFKCKICNKKLKSIKAHRTHIKGHMFQKYAVPVKCDHCEESFARRLDLHRHLIAVHDITESYTAVMGPEYYTNTLEKSKKFCLQDLGGYQCSLCNKVLSGENSFQRHMEFHNTMRCNYCFEYFNSKIFLDAHTMYSCDRKKVLGVCDPFDRRLKCHICYKPFSIAVKLRCHLRVAHDTEQTGDVHSAGAETFLCDFCFNDFPNEAQMLKHKRCHTRTGFFGCKLCPKKFSTQTLFQRHRKRHLYVINVDNPTKCEHCDETFPAYNKYILHLKASHDIDTDWLVPPKPSPVQHCTICDKDFSNLHNHLMYHEKYKCAKCCEYFLSASKFHSHSCSVDSEGEQESAVSAGRDSPDYKECDFCFKPINKVSTASRHFTNHTKIVHFGCRFCDKKFTVMSAFNMHGYSHRHRTYKKNPLRCRHCGESFQRYAAYVAHLRSVHEDHETLLFKPQLQEEECVICKKTFTNISLHYKHHLNFKCNVCQKYILSEKLFYEHVCNDPNADSGLVVEFPDDIAPLTMPRYFDECEMRHRDDSAIFTDEYFKEKLGDNYNLGENSIDIDDSTLDESILGTDMTDTSMFNQQDTLVSIPDQFFDADTSNQSSSFDNCTPIISSTVSLSLDAGKSTNKSHSTNTSVVDMEESSKSNNDDLFILGDTDVIQIDDSVCDESTIVNLDSSQFVEPIFNKSIVTDKDVSDLGNSCYDESAVDSKYIPALEDSKCVVNNADVSEMGESNSEDTVKTNIIVESADVSLSVNSSENKTDVPEIVEELCILSNAIVTDDSSTPVNSHEELESGGNKLSELKTPDIYESGCTRVKIEVLDPKSNSDTVSDKILEDYISPLNVLNAVDVKSIVAENFDQSSQEMSTSSISENIGIEIDGAT